MAYPPGELIPYFANPNVNWPGPNPPNPGPIGVPVGQPEPCDLALTIEDTRHIVANFRPTAVPGQPAVLHVRSDAGPGGNGHTWATAFNDLQDALCRAAGSGGAVREIWVQAGTYKPDRGTGLRSATFELASGVAIYGRFNGTETARDQRDFTVNATILSGDIGMAGIHTDNSYHVVTGSGAGPTAVLDGFTITRGQADGGTDAHDGGGGLLVYEGGSPTIVNCIFTRNVAAQYGGAVYNYLNASPTFIDCAFTDNSCAGTAWPAGGGALYSYDGCNPVLERCAFNGNTANLGGAMASLFGCGPNLSDCSFEGNTAADTLGEGGAMYNYSLCQPRLTGCRFINNSAHFGGGIANFFDVTAELVNCALIGNTSAEDGGGIGAYSNNLTRMTNCLFSGNTANYGGGMVNLFSSNATFINCTLAGNAGNNWAGGLFDYDNSDSTLINTILWGNRVGVVMDESAQLAAVNSAPAMSHCSVQGWTGALGGTANNGSDPLFVDADGPDDTYGTADDNPRPQPGSPAIDTGDTAYVPPHVLSDLDGGPRVLGMIVDRGAYEFVPAHPADYDHDGDVDAADLAAFLACASGPAIPRLPGCQGRDFDGDDDVDQSDYGAFQRCFSGADLPATAGCEAP